MLNAWMPENASERNGAADNAPPSSGVSESANLLLPQSLASVLDEAFDLYKQHFLTFAYTVALLYLPTQIVVQAMHYAWARPLLIHAQTSRGDAAVGLGMLYALLASLLGDPRSGLPGAIPLMALALASGPVAIAVSHLYLGKPITVRQAYRQARPRMASLLGGWIMVALAFIGIAFLSLTVTVIVFSLVITALTFAMGNNTPNEIVFALTLMMMLVPYLTACIVIAKWYTFTTPLIVLEGLPATGILGRNSRLVSKRRFWPTFGAVAFLPLFTFGIQGLVLLSINSAFDLFRLPPMVKFLTDTGVATGISFLFQPYWMIFLTLLYYDYRIRREGLDVRLLSTDLPALETTPAPAYAMPPQYPFPPTNLTPTYPIPNVPPQTPPSPPTAPPPPAPGAETE